MSKATIMVVDDDVLVRSVLKRLLAMHGYEVVEARDGQEALDLIDPKALPDLILMDHQMPRRSGIDCAGQLRTRFPFLRIVLISGSFGVNDADLQANRHLFTNVVLKPFQIRDVLGTVESAMGRAEQTARSCSGSARPGRMAQV